MNKELGVYPKITDKDFYKIINEKKEFWDNRADNKKSFNCLQPYQKLLSNFINPISPYSSILVYYGVGTGKTLTSIAIAENFKHDYKIIVCLKNNNLVTNYKQELLNNLCTVYNKEIKNGDNDTVKLMMKQINKYYTFLTYNELVSNVIGTRIANVGLQSKTKIKYKNIEQKFVLNNSVLIIDEVHNITEIKAYSVILDILKKGKNNKLVLMTATPIYDNIIEVFELNNLLNYDSNYVLPTSETSLLKNGFIEKDKKSVSLLNDTSYKLTKLGKDTLKKTLKGKISYLSAGNSNDYATKKFKGTLLSETNEIVKETSNIKIFKSYMSDFQKTVYRKTLTGNTNVLFKNSTDASLIVYPNKEYGPNGFINNQKNLDYLKKENLKNWSCKLFSLITELQESKGLCFIYSNFVNKGGIDLIKLVLYKNGFSQYKKNVNNKNSYIILKGNIQPKRIQHLLNIFNHPDNKNGEYIKIIIGSPVVSEGLTFKNIRQIHIIEPSWNMSKIDQIIGRGIRFQSHSNLPLKERNVQIYLHTAIDTYENSIDYLKYKLAENKDKSIKQIEYILREIAIDCFINKPVNIKNSIDFSRDCLYEKCKYTCSYETKDKIKINKDTYSIKYHDLEQYNFIFNKIIELYKIGFVYHITFIVNFIGNNVDKFNVYLVLYDICNEQIKIINKNNRKCILVNIQDYFLLQPENEKLQESFYYKLLENSISKVSGTNKKLTKRKSQPKQKITLRTLNANIYGTLLNKLGEKDNLFRLIHNKKFDKKDKRSFTNGKECKFYSKTELIDISKKLNLEKTELCSKEELCKLIYNDLKDKDLIIK